MKLSKPALIAILIVALLSLALWWRLSIWPYETTDNSYLKAHMTQVSPRESGYVKEVLFEDNQKVKAGDLLVVIDEADYQARLEEAEANVRVEQAESESLQRDYEVQKARIVQSGADLASADADLSRAQKDIKRFQNLVGEGAVSPQAHDSAEAEFRQSKASKDKAIASKDEAALSLDAISARIEESKARIRALTAELELARIALGHTRIVAPMSGIIGNRSVQVGQLVKPGNVLAYLIPDDEVFVEANFKETQIEDMKVGQPVDIKIDALPSEHFKGTVESFAPASGAEFSLLPPENATGNFTKIVRRVQVKIAFKPGTPHEALRPGLSTTVRVKVH